MLFDETISIRLVCYLPWCNLNELASSIRLPPRVEKAIISLSSLCFYCVRVTINKEKYCTVLDLF